MKKQHIHTLSEKSTFSRMFINWAIQLFKFVIFICFSFEGSLLSNEDRWHPSEYMHHVRSYEAWSIQRLNTHLFSGDEKILDFGCRDGRISAMVASKVPLGFVLGVDVSSSMVDYARSQFIHQENLQFELCPEANLECSNEFNLVTSFFMLQWIHDISLKMKQFQRCLAPGGLLWIVTTYKIPDSIFFAMKKLFSESKWEKYFEGYVLPLLFYNIEDYRKFLIEADLQLVQLQVLKGRELFSSRESFLAYLEQTFPIADGLSDELKRDCLADFIDIYLEFAPADRYGRIPLDRDIIEVKAKKKQA